eukprot:4774122-Pyramimonas_sp.AAC.1
MPQEACSSRPAAEGEHAARKLATQWFEAERSFLGVADQSTERKEYIPRGGTNRQWFEAERSFLGEAETELSPNQAWTLHGTLTLAAP